VVVDESNEENEKRAAYAIEKPLVILGKPVHANNSIRLLELCLSVGGDRQPFTVQGTCGYSTLHRVISNFRFLRMCPAAKLAGDRINS